MDPADQQLLNAMLGIEEWDSMLPFTAGIMDDDAAYPTFSPHVSHSYSKGPQSSFHRSLPASRFEGSSKPKWSLSTASPSDQSLFASKNSTQEPAWQGKDLMNYLKPFGGRGTHTSHRPQATSAAASKAGTSGLLHPLDQMPIAPSRKRDGTNLSPDKSTLNVRLSLILAITSMITILPPRTRALSPRHSNLCGSKIEGHDRTPPSPLKSEDIYIIRRKSFNIKTTIYLTINHYIPPTYLPLSVKSW
jgi:hypothetical protein